MQSPYPSPFSCIIMQMKPFQIMLYLRHVFGPKHSLWCHLSSHWCLPFYSVGATCNQDSLQAHPPREMSLHLPLATGLKVNTSRMWRFTLKAALNTCCSDAYDSAEHKSRYFENVGNLDLRSVKVWLTSGNCPVQVTLTEVELNCVTVRLLELSPTVGTESRNTEMTERMRKMCGQMIHECARN